jgi:hypothetical protein
MPNFNLHIIISGKKLFSISVTKTFLREELKPFLDLSTTPRGYVHIQVFTVTLVLR